MGKRQSIIITTIICLVDLRFSFRTRTVPVSRHFPIHFPFNKFYTRDAGIQLFMSGIAGHAPTTCKSKNSTFHGSFATADHLTSLFRDIFPDSPIAKGYSSSRTKNTCILNDAIAPLFQSTCLPVIYFIVT